MNTPATTRRVFGLAIIPVLGAIAILALMGLSVARHPSSLQGGGASLLWMDVGLLLIYGTAMFVAATFGSGRLSPVMGSATLAGSALGLVLVANHLTEWFVLDRTFVLVIAPVFIAVALMAGTGTVAMQRSRSLALAMVAGVWCAIVGTLLLLCVGFVLNLAFEARAERWLSDAFVASGTSDPGAFLVRNTLEAASEGLIRMPVAALFLSLLGALANAWFTRLSRRGALAVAASAVLAFLLGAIALSYANALPRAARPPFILPGVVLAGLGLAAAYPGWTALRRNRT